MRTKREGLTTDDRILLTSEILAERDWLMAYISVTPMTKDSIATVWELLAYLIVSWSVMFGPEDMYVNLQTVYHLIKEKAS